MATIAVKDANGSSQLVPVLPTNDGTTLPVSLSSIPLAAGAATEATVAAIAAAVAGQLRADTVVPAMGVNRGAVIGTAAVQLIAANPVRRGFAIQNQSGSANVYLSSVAAATADYNCLMIAPGGYYETPPHHAGTGAVSVIASAASTSIYAREW